MERYNEYKDSGVQWLGEIPSHWECEKAKRHFQSRKQIVGRNSSQYERLALTLKGVIKRFEGDGVGLNPEKLDTYQIVDKDDLIFKLIDLENVSTSRVGLSPYKGIVSPAYIRISAVDEVNIRFAEYYYLNMWMRHIFNDLGTPGVRSNLSSTDLLNLPLLYPSIVEQKAIASYLDKATAKIDEAIAQQQKMIGLLNERKQIIINNAVTKGLNPDAPMKDSGVDWIGEIPEHWIITKLKHLVEITDGTHDTPRYVDPSSNTYPLVTSRCIVNGVIDLSLANHITEQDYNYIATRSYVRRNDVIMPMIGTVGNPAIVDFEDSIAIKNVALFRTNGDINIAKFLKYLLNSTVVKEQFAMYNKGGVQNFVSQEILKNLAIIVPDNITDIVGFLEREIAKIETPIIAHNQQISLLQERKQIIINDVVTGKVKVS